MMSAAASSSSTNNTILTKDVSDWVSAIEAYVKETKPTCLDLRSRSISINEIASVLKILPDSEVIELNLRGSDLFKNVESLFELLKKTKIKKLNLISEHISDSTLVALMRLLCASEIVDLDDFRFSARELHKINDDSKFVNFLLQSCITHLNLNLDFYFESESSQWMVGLLANQLPHTSLSSLSLSGRSLEMCSDALVSLLSNLPNCQLKDLKLQNFRIDSVSLNTLSQNLANSKLEKLVLDCAEIDDAGLNTLAQGLPNSSVSNLRLAGNNISGVNSFFLYLKKSRVIVLDFAHNPIQCSEMFNCPEFLKGSLVEELNLFNCEISDEIGAELVQSLVSTKLTKLNLWGNNIGVQTFSAFTSVLEHSNLEDVKFLFYYLLPEAFDTPSGCIRQSKLKCVQFTWLTEKPAIPCLRFLAAIKNSSLRSIHIDSRYRSFPLDYFTEILVNSTFTFLELNTCTVSSIFTNLVSNLKVTCITRLNLFNCEINDENVQLLAEHLKDSKVLELNLGDNRITNEGARALAVCCPQTSVISLDLSGNGIKKDGLEILAKHVESSLITTFNVNHGEQILLDKVLWENRVSSHKIVSAFKRVFPENDNLCFRHCSQDRSVSDFLEQCLQFYKAILNFPQPAVVGTLLQGEHKSCLREKLVALIDNFPAQLVEFIGNWVEADASQHTKFLLRAKELGLTKIVELLLIHRPLYIIDEKEGILDPIVYRMLVEYKQPICNLAIEPLGIVKIINYFTKHSDLEGAEDVIGLLSTITMS